MKKLYSIIALFLSVLMLSAATAPAAPKAKAKAKAKRRKVSRSIKYLCSYDKSMQPALLMVAKTTDKPRPLFVVLHTWSGGCGQGEDYAKRLQKHDVHMISPHFRGPNTVGNKLAMGSEAAVTDVIDALKYMLKNYKIDQSRIYLIGGSGGGYMSLLVSSRHREPWAGVSAWCPISDLAAWQSQKIKGYYGHLMRTLGDTQKDPAAKAEALRRSPVSYLAGVTFPLDITHGIFDKVVPVSHALNAFNLVAAPADRFSAEEVAYINKNKRVPKGFPAVSGTVGKHKIYVRRISGNVRCTLFHSGHSINREAGILWLLKQQKGKPADFSAVDSNTESSRLAR